MPWRAERPCQLWTEDRQTLGPVPASHPNSTGECAAHQPSDPPGTRPSGLGGTRGLPIGEREPTVCEPHGLRVGERGEAVSREPRGVSVDKRRARREASRADPKGRCVRTLVAVRATRAVVRRPAYRLSASCAACGLASAGVVSDEPRGVSVGKPRLFERRAVRTRKMASCADSGSCQTPRGCRSASCVSPVGRAVRFALGEVRGALSAVNLAVCPSASRGLFERRVVRTLAAVRPTGLWSAIRVPPVGESCGLRVGEVRGQGVGQSRVVASGPTPLISAKRLCRCPGGVSRWLGRLRGFLLYRARCLAARKWRVVGTTARTGKARRTPRETASL